MQLVAFSVLLENVVSHISNLAGNRNLGGGTKGGKAGGGVGGALGSPGLAGMPQPQHPPSEAAVVAATCCEDMMRTLLAWAPKEPLLRWLQLTMLSQLKSYFLLDRATGRPDGEGLLLSILNCGFEAMESVESWQDHANPPALTMTPGLYRDTCFSERIQQVRL